MLVYCSLKVSSGILFLSAGSVIVLQPVRFPLLPCSLVTNTEIDVYQWYRLNIIKKTEVQIFLSKMRLLFCLGGMWCMSLVYYSICTVQSCSRLTFTFKVLFHPISKYHLIETWRFLRTFVFQQIATIKLDSCFTFIQNT